MVRIYWQLLKAWWIWTCGRKKNGQEFAIYIDSEHSRGFYLNANLFTYLM